MPIEAVSRVQHEIRDREGLAAFGRPEDDDERLRRQDVAN